MAKRLKILAVHGVSRHPRGGEWESRWQEAINASLQRVDRTARPEIHFLSYEDIFDAREISAQGTLTAVGNVLAGGLVSLLRARTTPVAHGTARGLSDVPDTVRWTAGMVTQWLGDSVVRRQTRQRLAAAIKDFNPDVVCAHSLGSLIAYDTFRDQRQVAAGLMQRRTFISFGSQLGNPFVKGQFAGRLEALDCHHWYHLYNPEDDVLTAPITIAADNFERVNCRFDIAGFMDHDAWEYLRHPNVSDVVWSDLLSPARQRRQVRRARAELGPSRSKRRALLIGINHYPQAEMQLEGCVNDVYLMSEVLQDSGFREQEIRLVLDHRATAQAIRDRIHWLLDGAQTGDERVLFFSGHGAQIPDYGPDETVDRLDECLVPWDFDWSRERAVIDNWFHDLYSQLPYDVRFLSIFDCCHSGGMTRAGLGRPRGLTPPDDIRHRMMRWDVSKRAWLPRSLPPVNRSLAESRLGADYLGLSGVRRRLGAAVDLRTLSNRAYDAERQRLGHRGPYMPVLLQACQEDQFAYEYRHGATPYGAFTYNLAQAWRGLPAERLTFRTLHHQATRAIAAMGYEQTPNLVGPPAWLNQPMARGRRPAASDN